MGSCASTTSAEIDTDLPPQPTAPRERTPTSHATQPHGTHAKAHTPGLPPVDVSAVRLWPGVGAGADVVPPPFELPAVAASATTAPAPQLSRDATPSTATSQPSLTASGQALRSFALGAAGGAQRLLVGVWNVQHLSGSSAAPKVATLAAAAVAFDVLVLLEVHDAAGLAWLARETGRGWQWALTASTTADGGAASPGGYSEAYGFLWRGDRARLVQRPLLLPPASEGGRAAAWAWFRAVGASQGTPLPGTASGGGSDTLLPAHAAAAARTPADYCGGDVVCVAWHNPWSASISARRHRVAATAAHVAAWHAQLQEGALAVGEPWGAALAAARLLLLADANLPGSDGVWGQQSWTVPSHAPPAAVAAASDFLGAAAGTAVSGAHLDVVATRRFHLPPAGVWRVDADCPPASDHRPLWAAPAWPHATPPLPLPLPPSAKAVLGGDGRLRESVLHLPGGALGLPHWEAGDGGALSLHTYKPRNVLLAGPLH